MTIHVSCAVEGGYVAHSAAMLHSVLTHTGELGVHVHYLHGPEFPDDAKRRLREMVERYGGAISFLEIPDEDVEGLPVRGFTLKATWYRIFLPERLPEVDRILYFDADLLVLDSLEPLWGTDLTGHYLGAVTNVFEPQYVDRPAGLGLAGTHVYFNAGVLLMNLDLMRREGSTRALKDYGVEHAPELYWRDQDALNVVLGERRLPLHPRWNCMNSVLIFPWAADVFGAQAVEEARRNPAIRHFEGPDENKPWHYLCERGMRELYFEHRSQTPWPRYRLRGVTPRNIAKRMVRDFRQRSRWVSA